MRRSKTFSDTAWLNNQILQRVQQALAESQREFVDAHRDAGDSVLLDYVVECAAELGHSPQACELIGGEYIAQRFGNWENVLAIAGLPEAKRAPSLNNREIFRREYERQLRAFKQERYENKLAQEKMRAHRKAEKRVMQKRQLDEDLSWGKEHSHLSYGQLLEHVRSHAMELGYTPSRSQVLGGRYIAQRFGSWAVTLTLAGLPLPKDLKPPKDTVVEVYRNKLKKESEE